MSKGGHAASGPAPDPKALRRERDAGDWVELPASGRGGDAPEWPLSDPSQRELELWEEEWRRPQAIMWERNGQELEVAIFVRTVRQAEQPNAPVNARTLVKQQMEALGVSVPGLRRNQWRIVADVSPKKKRKASAGGSARDRLKLVSDES